MPAPFVRGMALALPLALSLAALLTTAHAQPARPEIPPLLDLGDGGGRLVELPHAEEPALGGRFYGPAQSVGADYVYDYLEASDGTVYRVSERGMWCWTPGATRDEALSIPFGRGDVWGLSGLVDEQLVVWNNTTDFAGRSLSIRWFTRCTDGVFESERVVRVREEGVETPFLTPGARSSGVVFARDGKICGGGGNGWGCVDPAVDPAVEPAVFEMWLTPEAVAAQLPRGTDFLAQVLAAAGVDEDAAVTWSVVDQTHLPDGRIAAIISAQFQIQTDRERGPAWVRWAVMIDPATGAARDLLEPVFGSNIAVTPYDNPLGQAQEIHYDAAWDAVWVGPVVAWTPSSLALAYDVGASINELLTKGRTSGVGYRVLPLDDAPGRNGYLDLSNALFWLNPCVNDAIRGCVPAKLFRGLSDRQHRLFFRRERDGPYTLAFDRDGVDRDGDGWSLAQETARGTSDLAVDTDGDGAYDALEAAVGRDPLTPDAPVRAPLLYSISHMIYRDLPPIEDRYGHSLARVSPLCGVGRREDARFVGRCRDLAGRVLVEWAQEGGATPIVAADGRHVMVIGNTAVRQIDLETGEDRVWFERGDIHPHIADRITGGPESFFLGLQDWAPVDRDTVFMGTTVDPFVAGGLASRYLRIDGGPGEPKTVSVLFDTADDPCAAGLAGCTDEVWPGHQEGPRTARPHELSSMWAVAMGYHLESERFVVGVGGALGSHLLGFHATEPPIRLSRARGIYPLDRAEYVVDVAADWCTPFPGWMQPAGPDAYRMGIGDLWRGGALDRVPRERRHVVRSQSCDSGAVKPYIAPKGPPTLAGHFISSHIIEPYLERRVNPGDSLFLGGMDEVLTGVPHDRSEDGRMLYSIGPLGALVALWDDADPLLVRGTGMDVAADGRLCVADRPGAQLIEYLPDAATAIPDVVGRRVEGLDAIDCLWRDGRLLALTDEAIVEVDADGMTSEIERHGAASPVDLAPDGDGWQVLDRAAADAPLGFVRRQDGTVDPITALEQGTPADDHRVELPVGQPTTAVHAVERSDGTVLITTTTTVAEAIDSGEATFGVYGGVRVLDGRGGLRMLWDPHTPGYFQTVAQVPGAFDDPWDGAQGPVCWFDPTLPECAVERADPSPLGGGDAGVDAGAGGLDPAEDDGCACRADDGGPLGLLWLLPLVLAGRRGRNRSS